MSSKYGDNSKPKATSDNYRSSYYWKAQEERKKAEAEKKAKLQQSDK